jgi:hypothetical protein
MIVGFLDGFVALMAKVPGGLIYINSVDLPKAILFFLLALTVMAIIHFRSIAWLKWCAVVLGLIAVYATVLLLQESEQELLVFYDSNTPAVEYVSGIHSNLVFDPEDKETSKYVLKPAQKFFGISSRTQIRNFENSTYTLGGYKVATVQDFNYHIPEKVDFIYLSTNAEKFNPEFVNSLDCRKIILGRSCSFQTRRAVKSLVQESKIHDLRSDGSLVLTL